MASCECCWSEAAKRTQAEPIHEEYLKVLVEHRLEHCVCNSESVAGRKARAGQFWDEATQRDRREVGDHG